MKAVTNQRVYALLLSLLACIFLFNALRAAQGQEAKEPAPEQKVKDLEKQVDTLKTQVDTLTER